MVLHFVLHLTVHKVYILISSTRRLVLLGILAVVVSGDWTDHLIITAERRRCVNYPFFRIIIYCQISRIPLLQLIVKSVYTQKCKRIELVSIAENFTKKFNRFFVLHKNYPLWVSACRQHQ